MVEPNKREGVATLAEATVFRDLPHEALALIEASATLRRFPSGRALMLQDDPSDCMHIILSGRVSLERAHPHLIERIILAELGPGEVVGEMGVLDGEPRSATVIASVPTETLEVDAALLRKVIALYPEVSTSLVRVLSQRLRTTNQLAEHYLERVQQ